MTDRISSPELMIANVANWGRMTSVGDDLRINNFSSIFAYGKSEILYQRSKEYPDYLYMYPVMKDSEIEDLWTSPRLLSSSLSLCYCGLMRSELVRSPVSSVKQNGRGKRHSLEFSRVEIFAKAVQEKIRQQDTRLRSLQYIPYAR